MFKPGDTIIDVDSTVSFPESGSLVTTDIDNNKVILSYESKSIDQFIGVTGILNNLVGGDDVHLNQVSYAKVGPNAEDRIEVRISATLTDLQLPPTTRYLTGDKIFINNFGYEGDDERLKNWNYNVKSKFNVESISLVDITEDKYSVKTFDNLLEFFLVIRFYLRTRRVHSLPFPQFLVSTLLMSLFLEFLLL